MNVRHIRIDIDPHAFAPYGGKSPVVMARIEVDLFGREDRICYSEAIPDDDFMHRFHWMMARATQEVTRLLKEPGIVVE